MLVFSLCRLALNKLMFLLICFIEIKDYLAFVRVYGIYKGSCVFVLSAFINIKLSLVESVFFLKNYIQYQQK